MGNLIEVYSKNNVPKNQRKCFFWFCFLKLFNVIHNTKKAQIYLLIQLLIKTKLNVNSQLRLRLSVVKVELKVGKNRINFSKNTFKLTNTVTKANIVIKDQEFYTFHFTDHINFSKQNKTKKYLNSFDKTVMSLLISNFPWDKKPLSQTISIVQLLFRPLSIQYSAFKNVSLDKFQNLLDIEEFLKRSQALVSK